MNFSFLTGDMDWKTYGGTFVSKRLNNGEFDYRLLLDVTPLDDDTRYIVSLNVVAPSQCMPKELQRAIDSFGMPEEDLKRFVEQGGDLALTEILHDYGISLPVWSRAGNNIGKMMRAARAEANLVESMFGFYLDRQYNAVGATGWDIIRGDMWGNRED